MKYNPSRDIPQAVRELKVLSPSRIVLWILNKRNVERTSQSVTMWFTDHPNIYDELQKEIVQGVPTEKQAVDVGLFENGAFREIPSVKSWVRDLTNSNAKQTTIDHFARTLKHICKGELREIKVDGKIQWDLIPDWAWKHPDRLSLEDAKAFLYEVKTRKLRSREWRLVLRNFLASKGFVIKKSDISGELEEDAGKYNTLRVSREKREAIFRFLDARNHEAYLISKFGYVTASRLTAAITADSNRDYDGNPCENFDHEDHAIYVYEKAVMGKPKKKVKKYLTNDLYEELKDRKGKIFNIEAEELNGLLREAYEAIIPETNKIIPMPFHFWRHCFAQDMLRASGWNYALVASLGNWSVEALRRYYGAPNEEDIRRFVKETLPKLEAQTVQIETSVPVIVTA
jgi:hypothetical protein